MKRRRSASVRANSRILFEAEVIASANSCSRGEPVKPVSEKPGGASTPMLTSPTWTAKGAASTQEENNAAVRAAKVRTRCILADALSFHFSESRLTTILGKLPTGEKVGIAFSGGL